MVQLSRVAQVNMADLPLFVQAGDFGAILLRNQLKELCKNPVDGFSVGLVDDSNIYEWQVLIEGPPGTLFEGGLFPCILKFPREYPNKVSFLPIKFCFSS